MIRGQVSEERDTASVDLPRALAAAEHAVELAKAGSDDEVLARALEARGRILFTIGPLDKSLRDWEAVAASAEMAGILDLAAKALAVAHHLYQCRGEFAASQRCIERAVALIEHGGNPWTMALVLDNHGLLAYAKGNWDEARTDYERAVATMRAVDTTLSYSFPPLLLGLLHLAQGQ
jgi:tetratricopeptide (TPR) repeat protein